MNNTLAIYNTVSDAANTAVRAFLTKVGEFYLGHSSNTGNGKGKSIWISIRDVDFDSCCAYCGERSKILQVEHVVMFNRTEYGLHHPGNTVPCCKICNKREKDDKNVYCNWEEHLKKICSKRGEIGCFQERRERIMANFEKYQYPALNENEKLAIQVIAKSLYENIKAESDKSLNMYKELDKAFVK